MKKVLYTIIALAIGIAGYFMFSQPQDGDQVGQVTVVLIDEFGVIISDESYEFQNEMSLYDLMQENYEIGCASPSYTLTSNCEQTLFNSHIILQINEISTDWTNSFLRIYVNDIPSEYGIDLIMLVDESQYKFVYTQIGGE